MAILAAYGHAALLGPLLKRTDSLSPILPVRVDFPFATGAYTLDAPMTGSPSHLSQRKPRKRLAAQVEEMHRRWPDVQGHGRRSRPEAHRYAALPQGAIPGNTLEQSAGDHYVIAGEGVHFLPNMIPTRKKTPSIIAHNRISVSLMVFLFSPSQGG